MTNKRRNWAEDVYSLARVLDPHCEALASNPAPLLEEKMLQRFLRQPGDSNKRAKDLQHYLKWCLILFHNLYEHLFGRSTPRKLFLSKVIFKFLFYLCLSWKEGACTPQCRWCQRTTGRSLSSPSNMWDNRAEFSQKMWQQAPLPTKPSRQPILAVPRTSF